jgi:hypothetical protein
MNFLPDLKAGGMEEILIALTASLKASQTPSGRAAKGPRFAAWGKYIGFATAGKTRYKRNRTYSATASTMSPHYQTRSSLWGLPRLRARMGGEYRRAISP